MKTRDGVEVEPGQQAWPDEDTAGTVKQTPFGIRVIDRLSHIHAVDKCWSSRLEALRFALKRARKEVEALEGEIEKDRGTPPSPPEPSRAELAQEIERLREEVRVARGDYGAASRSRYLQGRDRSKP